MTRRDLPPCHPRKQSASCLTAFLLLLLGLTLPAHAHVGSKDVFEQVGSGPYTFFVTVRPPAVIPGVATVEVRVAGPAIDTLNMAPVPLTGEGSHHPPAPDAMHRSPADPQFFTGSLWLMASGSWQVRLQATGAEGPVTVGVPVAAVALSVQRMQRPLGSILAVLALVLAVGMAGIIYGAVRESRLPPGASPTPDRRRRAVIAGLATFLFVALAAWGGDQWWNVQAADYADNVFRPLALHPSLLGNTLLLRLDPFVPKDPDRPDRRRANDDLLPDHGHLMHLYAIRWPEMDAVYHLHPHPAGPGRMLDTLPSMPPGVYHLFADIVHRNGLPETLTASIEIPPDASHFFLDPEDASAYPAPLSGEELGPSYRLPDGYTMVWDRPARLTANTAELFRFRLVDTAGRPAKNMRPYLGMAGHAAFVKTDGTVFAHTHPDGSAAMPALMLANANAEENMSSMTTVSAPGNPGTGGADVAQVSAAAVPLAPVVQFPYGFPNPGRYRIFIQMKHDEVVETGVFDAEVK